MGFRTSLVFGCDVGERYQYVKAHRLPFDKSLSRCQAQLECICTDLMGHCTTTSNFVSRSVLLFVDEFSRYTWVNFVKEKSEVFSK